MIFASPIFLFWFLPLVLGLYYVAPRPARNVVLLLASYVFYGWWRLDFCVLMVVSTVVDYALGALIARADPVAERRRRKLALLGSLIANLGLLGYFKYANFGVESLNAILLAAGYEGVTWTSVVLPVGISFYTFQTLSYTIDLYRGDTVPARNVLDFATYVALFPQLVAGPIVRYATVAEELRSRPHDVARFGRGAFLFQIGFAKKILIADAVAPVADAAYALADPSFVEGWIGTFAYAMQIYFDFSGYSDMAIGLGLMFGFTFPINFDSPYKSRSVTEFWRRWHVSLSTWLRDYLYIPLGGNRKGPRRTYVNLMATMLLGGLWHGAAWTFVLWGAWQGAFLALERSLGRRSPWGEGAPRALAVAATFVITCFGWVLFRATSVDGLLSMFRAMLGFPAAADAFASRLPLDTRAIAALTCAGVLAFFFPNSQELANRPRAWPRLLGAVLLPVAVCEMLFSSYSPFLYFQF